MTYSATIQYSGTDDVNAKPITPGLPPNNSPWTSDLVAKDASSASGAIVFKDLADGVEYWVYVTPSGDTPSNSDPRIHVILPKLPLDTAAILAALKADAVLGTASGGMVANVATAATEVAKIPRAAAAVTAGAAVRRTKVAATSSTLDETLGATP